MALATISASALHCWLVKSLPERLVNFHHDIIIMLIDIALGENIGVMPMVLYGILLGFLAVSMVSM